MIQRLLLFAGIAALFSLIGPQIGFLIAEGTPYEETVNGNWDAAAAASGLLVFGALVFGWGSWLCFTVSGGFRDNNVVGGLLSLMTGALLIGVAVFVAWKTVLA
ncbi:hypothetical protein [Streptomyces sp. 7N604]|uniref:hypothetical protein n=1 Tax=Streptomyces sp. 7N604 TaxID=3457415 RepID=UPI003FD34910